MCTPDKNLKLWSIYLAALKNISHELSQGFFPIRRLINYSTK